MYRFGKWREALQLAPNVKTLHALMRDYVAILRPELEKLPPDCRHLLEGEVDVQAAAVALLKEELRFQGPEETRELLHEVAHTFASAAIRITLLHPRATLRAA